jgi:acetylornithine deacetylase/succinyl-diaminopimelate desuccinylase-like protein
MTQLTPIQILKELISIPSWVDKNTNESKIGDYIVNFLNKKTKLNVAKQHIGMGRYNIIATNSNKIDTLITGHIDTVKPNSGWTKKPTLPRLIQKKLYGLGSTDMKTGIALMLYFSTFNNLNENLGFLFYCDEEYDFLGMKKFIEKYENKISPNLIISLDGEGNVISNCCRGLIELKVKVIGKAGHAANLKSGINAISESYRVIEKLRTFLNKFKTSELGESTLNVAYINGGSSEGNIIAEKCEYIVEIRIGSENLTAAKAINFIKKESSKSGLIIESITTRHDLGAWITDKGKLSSIIKYSGSNKLKTAKDAGYSDIQMLWKTFKKIPCFCYGLGEKGLSHKADEYIKEENIVKGEKFLKQILVKKEVSKNKS